MEIADKSAHDRYMETWNQRGLIARCYDFFVAGLASSVVRSITVGPTQSAPLPLLPPQSTSDSSAWIDDVARASVQLVVATTKTTYVGNGVAISDRLVLTALHGMVKIGQKIVVTDKSGDKHDGRVHFVSYAKDVKDIAVIRVDPPMSRFVPLATKRVTLGEEICVIGYKLDSRGEACLFFDSSTVKCIESEPSTMYMAGYTSYDGLSGAGVFVGRGAGGKAVVVGVHIASHDSIQTLGEIVSPYEDSPPSTSPTEAGISKATSSRGKSKGRGKDKVAKDSLESPVDLDVSTWVSRCASKESVQAICESINSELHGHMSYTLVCEPLRVDELSEYLVDQGYDYHQFTPYSGGAVESKESR